MKVALLITTFNRPQYLKQCFDSLNKADLSLLNEILIVDDCSTDQETINLIMGFKPIQNTQHLRNDKNSGIKHSLLTGYELLFLRNEIVINLDGDALVRRDFLGKLVFEYWGCVKGQLLTGFHSITKNANGTDRHKIIGETATLYRKQSVGGINFYIDKEAYDKFLRPALEVNGNFDHKACINANGAWCLKESVIEHIGFDSSMNHTEQPDVAANFYFHDLKDVTLVAIDGRGAPTEAINKTKKYLKFGAELVITDPKINSVEEYSKYLIRELASQITTSHMLIIQHDGYVINPNEWDPKWLEYDYIGATWWYNDGMNVGNGGFSLRSKRLMELCKNFNFFHPEDHHICRTYRRQLEAQGMKFAPDEVADKFSHEGYRQPNKKLTNQFGFHRNPGHRQQEFKVVPQQYVVGQFASLGDIIWLVPLIRALQDEGHEMLWPVNPEYISLKKHFPDLNFVNKNDYNINYDQRIRIGTPYGIWLPYRYASENMGLTLKNCMDAKYRIYGHDWKMFRQLYWKRDEQAEQALEIYLNLPKEYILVNRFFGNQAQFKIEPQIESNLPRIEMRPLQGFTIFDWCSIIEKASEIHSANTSLLYLLETMMLEMPIHLYNRGGLWGEDGFSYTSFIHSKPYILH